MEYVNYKLFINENLYLFFLGKKREFEQPNVTPQARPSGRRLQEIVGHLYSCAL